MIPSAARLAATGLAIAAIVISALAALALLELDREAELHREVIEGMHAKDSLEALRLQLSELAHAARIVALAGDARAAQAIEHRAVEVKAELGYLAQHAARGGAGDAFAVLRRSAASLVLQSRSIAPVREARGADAARSASSGLDATTAEAMTALERLLEAHVGRINERTLDQIRVGETLRAYVSWLLAGSVLVLLGLFAVYRWAMFREREARRRIEHLAHYDVVTGLPNRALLSDRLEQEVARARRETSEFGVLMIDLDGFKEVNDRWGHAAGDRVLGIVGTRARQCVRASDTVGRIGGDEFMAVLPDTSREGTLAVAAKIVEALAWPYPLEQGEARLSASVGAGVFPADGAEPESLRRAADAALYAAKREGKNRVRGTSASEARASNGAVA